MGARSNRGLVKWMREDGLDVGPLKDMVWEEFDWATMTQASTDQREAVTAEFFARHDKAFLFGGALTRKIMLYPVATPRDMVAFDQLQARGFWVEVDHPELGRALTYPGPWGSFSATPLAIRRRAPLIGEHNQEIYGGELGLSPAELADLAQAGVI
jgi:crotonobetainyl-CoA:carnitine CoA-transferase CaiB-like acyl-CoA transferase